MRSLSAWVAIVAGLAVGGAACGSPIRVTFQPDNCRVRFGTVGGVLTIENTGTRTDGVDDPEYFRIWRIYDQTSRLLVEDRTFAWQYDLILRGAVELTPGQRWTGRSGHQNDVLKKPGVYGLEWEVLDRYSSASPRTWFEMAEDLPSCVRDGGT